MHRGATRGAYRYGVEYLKLHHYAKGIKATNCL